MTTQEVYDVLDVSAAAERMGVHRRTFHRNLPSWIAEGRLHPVQSGRKGRVYYAEWEVDGLTAVSHSFPAVVRPDWLKRAA